MKVSVYVVELPKNVHGISTSEFGENTIYINTNDSMFMRTKTYFRGIARLMLEHFESDKPYSVCEEEANMYAYSQCAEIGEGYKSAS